MNKKQWETALTDAMDWVNEPHRAPLHDQLAIGKDYTAASIMRMQARLLDKYRGTYDREIRDKHDTIIVAWNIEASLREEGLLEISSLVRCEHGHDLFRGSPAEARAWTKKEKACETCGEPPMYNLVMEYKVT